MTDARLIEAALARAGWSAGAEALVAGWVDQRKRELEWEDTWKPDDRRRYISSECPAGERFVIEWMAGDTWELSISLPDGWGSEHVCIGFLEDLQELAEEIYRADGPFCGPDAPMLPMCALPGQRGKRLAGHVELRFERLREDLAAYFFIMRQGNLNNLWIVHIEPGHLPAALDSLDRTPRCAPSLWVQTQDRRWAWSFTAWRPLLARMLLGKHELLLSCPDASTAVILAHARGRLQAAVQIGMRELPDFDAKGWLSAAPQWSGTSHGRNAAGSSPRPNSSPPPPPTNEAAPLIDSAADTEVEEAQLAEPSPPAGRSVAEATQRPVSSEPPEPASRPSEQPKPRFPLASDASAEAIQRHFSDVEAAIPPRLIDPATETEVEEAQLAEPSPPAGRSVAEATPRPVSPGPHRLTVRFEALTPEPPVSSDPQRTAESEPPEPASRPPAQPKPRFPLASDASAEAIQRHFSDVEAAIPPRLIGAATAVELWLAIREAYHHEALPITGPWVDLVAALHHRGFLSHLPSDRASRAALAILAELSPLVRRLHHRRWVLGGER